MKTDIARRNKYSGKLSKNYNYKIIQSLIKIEFQNSILFKQYSINLQSNNICIPGKCNYIENCNELL